MPGPFIVHINCAPSHDVHPEPLAPHRIVRDCEAVHGFPKCEGAAYRGPEFCTCRDTLSAEDHAKCIAEAQRSFDERGGDMCHDCAFRVGSPEQDELAKIASSPVPFRCHQGMPVNARGGVPRKDAYSAVLVETVGADGKRHLESPDYPICAGWQRAHAALSKRAPAAPKRFQLRRVKGYRKPEDGVVCTRASRWGNPYAVVPHGDIFLLRGIPRTGPVYELGAYTDHARAVHHAIEAFRTALRSRAGLVTFTVDDVRRELAGKDLGCFCELSDACHADVLLRVASGGDP